MGSLHEDLIIAFIMAACVAASGCDGHANGTALSKRELGELVTVKSTAIAPLADLPAPRVRETYDWPNFLGPHHDAVSSEQGIQLDWDSAGPKELWRIRVGTGYSSPIVAGARLILMHRIEREEFVECFEADTGQSLWRHAYTSDFECQYQYSSGPYSTPAVDNGRVYAWSAEGVLRCLQLKSGELIWQRDLNNHYFADVGMFPVAGSVLVHDDRLILNVGGRETGAGVVALDKRSGDTLWTATSDGPGDATAVAAEFHGRGCLLMFTADGLAALKPQDGEVHWQIPFRARAADTSNATTPVVVGDKVFLTAYKAGSLCIRVLPEGGYEELWRDRRNLMCQFHNLIVRDHYVYGFASNDHSFRCIDSETGDVQWKWQPEQGRGQSLLVEDRLITVFETGHLAAVDISPEGWHVQSMTAAPVVQSRCYSSPALAGGRLFLRSDTDVVCLSLK